jgi:hypothetical protein
MSENQEEIVDFVVEGINLADESLTGWDGSFGPQLPPGEYLFEVANVKINDKKNGPGQTMELTLRVETEGEFQGQTVKNWLGLPNAESKPGVARRIAHVVRDVLQTPLLPSGGFQTSSMIGKRMYATVVIEQQKEFDPVKSQEVTRDRLRIQNERRAEEVEAPQVTKSASAPASKPPATNGKAATTGGKPAAAPAARR